MATLTRRSPGVIINFRAENVQWVPEGSSAGFKSGDFVKLSSGKVVVAAAAGNTLAASVLYGMALADASGTSTATNTVPVYVFDGDTILRLPVVSGSSSAVSTALTDVGTAYGIRHTATTDGVAADAWAVDKNETSAVYGQVESIPLGSGYGGSNITATDANGLVNYRINLNKVQGAGVTP